MNPLVTRTVSVVSPQDDPRFGRDGLSLADFKSDHSYVLLGEPGMGKTTTLRDEAERAGGTFVEARRFLSRAPEHHPEWRDTTVFVDGLDEVRVGTGDPRTPLDGLITRLEALGNPPFRLSCRAGSWLDPGDARELASLTGAGEPSNTEGLRVLMLHPLSRDDVRQIVSSRREDAEGFIADAFDHGLETFLWNPQLLKVLLDAVESSGWPDSPRAAFERACRELARERNPEHRDAHQGSMQPPQDALLRAAGRLSALLLLTDKGGWSATDTDHPDILSLRAVDAEDDHEATGGREALLAAVDSRLFSGTSAARRPTHRMFAEFLGAGYLDHHIRAAGGPGTRRVLSLLLGHDGVPLPDLRGLCAWLAALNPDARSFLIRADPISVAFDGDASDFTPEERRQLFAELEHCPSLPSIWPSSVALGALAGSRQRSPLWTLLTSSNRTDARQALISLLLAGFARKFGERAGDNVTSPTMDRDIERRTLLQVVRDDTWRDDVRCRAIVALDRILPNSGKRSAALHQLLSDVEAGHISDPYRDLLGTLLDQMYPGDIRPNEIWDHLVPQHRRPGVTSYSMFWLNLIDGSKPEHIRQLLESLCDHDRYVVPKLDDNGFGHVAMELLARGLELFGDDESTADLYRWFRLVDAARQHTTHLVLAHGDELWSGVSFFDHASRIRDWLHAHESTRRDLILCDLVARETEIEAWMPGHREVGSKFMRGPPPRGFRDWCLEQAVKFSDDRPVIARNLASWATGVRTDWEAPLSDEEVARTVRNVPVLRAWNEERLRYRARRERENTETRERHTTAGYRVQEQRREYVARVREHTEGLAEGRGPPELLHQLAQAYFDELDEGGSAADPLGRLRKHLDDDEALVRATLAGFRELLARDDLPDLATTVQLHEAGRFSWLDLPFLAGLAEEERAGSDPLELLDEAGLRRALGYWLVSGPHTQRFAAWERSDAKARPRWYRRVLDSHPEAVADAMVAVHLTRVRMKAGPDRSLREMREDPAYARVTPLAVKRMFGVFPSRCTESQVETLRLVMWAAFDPRNMAPSELASLVRRRLERRGMDVAQRVQWLCAGLFVARSECLPKLGDYLAEGTVQRAHHLVNFFMSVDHELRGALALDDWETDELALFLRAAGGGLRRYEPPEGVGMLSDEQVGRLRAEPLIRHLIEALAGRADDETATELEALACDPDLAAWRAELIRAREEQAERLRVAKHAPPTLLEIQETLRGGSPCSAADLVALVLDTLEELAKRIRDDSTNDWTQYWHFDGKPRRPLEPRYENDCRDTLLSDLRLLLKPYGIDAHREGQYAEDKRADIRVALGSGVAIPVEIKRNSYREIWRAVEEQLIPKYTRAPESEGYGIYLVFWFGRDHMKVEPPRGRSPRTAAELRERLEELLTPGRRAKIGVVVIDASPSGRYASG